MTRPQRTFSFLDESGLLIPTYSKEKNIQHFSAIGLLKHPDPFTITQKLHKHYEQLCAILKQDNTRIEFSFKGITEKNLLITLKVLDVLKDDPDWLFRIVYFDTSNSNYHKYYKKHGKWGIYIRGIKTLVQEMLKEGEQTVLLADFLNKPKRSSISLGEISRDSDNIYGILQVISHGIPLVQITDLILGSFVYNIGGFRDKKGYKTIIAEKVMSIKNSVGEERFKIIAEEMGSQMQSVPFQEE